jgi:hypothetical protein
MISNGNTSNTNPKVTHVVTFNQNGGSGTMSPQVVDDDVKTTLNSNAFIAPTGYKFAGWTTNCSGAGTSYCEKDYLSLTSDIMLYAIWVTTETKIIAQHNSINLIGFTNKPTGMFNIPCGITGICDSTFFQCTSITSVTIPLSVTEIDLWAFAYSGISSITIPASVTSMDENPFVNCSNLVSISIDENNTKYSSDAQGCVYNKDKTLFICAPSKLTTVNIPSTVAEIQDIAFYISSLNSIIIPSSVKKIGSAAFANTWLTTITIPSSVTSIGDKAFSMTSLATVSISSSVSFIGNEAFGFTPMTSINVDSNNPNYSSINGVLFNKSVTTLLEYPTALSGPYTIPSSVTSIDDNAFDSCSITSVTIPSNISTIGDRAFFQCSGLTSIYENSTTPPTLNANSGVFDRLPIFIIYVPAGSVSSYKAATGWSNYASNISSM